MADWSDGLLGGANDAATWFDQGLLGSTTQVPTGVNYRPEDQRMARMAMLGSAGATLLAAAQRGQVGQRGQMLAQLANVPQQYAATMQNAEQLGMQRKQQASAQELQGAQIAALRAKMTGAQAMAQALGGGMPSAGAAPAGAAPAGAAPAGAAPGAAPPDGTAPPAGDGGYYNVLQQVENATGDPAAKNPRSTATGDGQFIESTWLRFAGANPELFAGMNRQQILAKRADPELSKQASAWNARENATELQNLGLPVNDGTVALAHRFGAAGAATLLRAPPGAPAASVLPAEVITANPTLAQATAGGVVRGVGSRFGTGNTWQQAPTAPSPLTPQQQALTRPAPGYNGNTVANMPPELRAMAVARAQAGDTDGASEIVTKWLTTQPRTVQTVTAGGEVREVTPSGELGRNYGRAGEEGRPLTAQDRAAFPNLDPRKQYYMKDGVPHEIGTPSTNVSIQTDNAAREVAVRRIEQARTLSDPVMANAVPQAIVMREQLLAGLPTGQIDAATLTARTVLQSMGLLTPEQARTADAQTLFRAMSSAMIPGMRAAGSGSSSDLDVKMFAQASPTLATSPAGNLIIASAFIQQKQHEQNRISAMEDYLSEKGSLVGFDKHWRENGPPLFPKVTSREEALTGYPPGTVIMLPPAAKNSTPTYPFYVVPAAPPPDATAAQ